MDPMTLAVAGVAAAAIFMIAIGIATSGSGSGVSARLERYAAGRDPNAAASSGSALSDMIAQSVALAQLNRVVEGKIQGRLKPTGIRPKFVEKFEIMGINLPPGLFGFTY